MKTYRRREKTKLLAIRHAHEQWNTKPETVGKVQEDAAGILGEETARSGEIEAGKGKKGSISSDGDEETCDPDLFFSKEFPHDTKCQSDNDSERGYTLAFDSGKIGSEAEVNNS